MKKENKTEINYCNLPELIAVDTPDIIKKVSDCLENAEDEEWFEKIEYKHYFLDQFEDWLPKGSEKLIYIDNDFCRLKKEPDYISFLNKLFMENGFEVLLFNLGIDFSDVDTCIYKIERFDKIDQHIILNIHKSFIESETYQIKDINLFEFIIKSFLREANSGYLYFENLNIFLAYGYDMVLHLFFKKSEDINSYKNIAKQFKELKNMATQ